jgi:transcription initiation factor TFIIIB Brf1 subunit/transcription initiation factor TFIIB
MLPGGTELTRPGRSRHLILAQNKERLDGALSYLELPQHVANAARRLLDQVVKAYGQAEQLMQVSPATVAAVIYTTARQEGRALSMGAVASTLDVTGPEVFREFRWVHCIKCCMHPGCWYTVARL